MTTETRSGDSKTLHCSCSCGAPTIRLYNNNTQIDSRCVLWLAWTKSWHKETAFSAPHYYGDVLRSCCKHIQHTVDIYICIFYIKFSSFIWSQRTWTEIIRLLYWTSLMLSAQWCGLRLWSYCKQIWDQQNSVLVLVLVLVISVLKNSKVHLMAAQNNPVPNADVCLIQPHKCWRSAAVLSHAPIDLWTRYLVCN